MIVEAFFDSNIYWDGAIVAAAARLGAPVLYSEVLSHGQDYDGVRVINPFQ